MAILDPDLLEDLNPADINDWIELAKYHKGLWVKATIRGDLTPTVFAERNGVVLCAVVAPQVDKEYGLHAAALLRKATNTDIITMIVDAHISHGKKDESKEEFLSRWKPGEMQRQCDEEGACELGLISDCLVCHRIGRDKKMKMASIPYYYHGKETTFKWLNDPEGFHQYVIDENLPGQSLDGNIPHALRKIMDLPSFLDDPQVQLMAKKLGGGNHDRQLYHTTRAMYTALSADGFMVFDYGGHNRPWEEFNKK